MIFRIQTADIKRIHDGFYDQRDSILLLNAFLVV